MTLDEYKVLAMRSRNTNLPYEMALADSGLGLAGEAGEYADIIKKVVSQGHPLDGEKRAKLRKELGDILWYVAEAATLLDFLWTKLHKKTLINSWPVTRRDSQPNGA